MRLGVGALLFLIAAFTACSGAAQQEIREAELRGDYEAAVAAAQQCIARYETTGEELLRGQFCLFYYATALKIGRGVARDKRQACLIFKGLAAVKPDGKASLELAECYLDGTGVPRDPVEAAVIVWKVQNGPFSSYCTECGDLFEHARALHLRLKRELSSEERTKADRTKESRYPDIVAGERRTGFIVVVLALGLLLVISRFFVSKLRRRASRV